MTQMNLAVKEKQTYRYRERVCSCQEEGELGEGWIRSLGLTDADYSILVYRSYYIAQYPVIMNNVRTHTHIYITKSLCSGTEINKTL